MGETPIVAANPRLRLYRDPGPMVRSERATHVSGDRPPLTAEDLRIHAWINQRLAALHRERHGLWAKVRRVLLRNRPLAYPPDGVAAEAPEELADRVAVSRAEEPSSVRVRGRESVPSPLRPISSSLAGKDPFHGTPQ
jgi:hypothetical protein